LEPANRLERALGGAAAAALRRSTGETAAPWSTNREEVGGTPE
jgi:hypothetical protein